MLEYDISDIVVIPSTTLGWTDFFANLADMREWINHRCGTDAKIKFHLDNENCTLIVPSMEDYLAFRLRFGIL